MQNNAGEAAGKERDMNPCPLRPDHLVFFAGAWCQKSRTHPSCFPPIFAAVPETAGSEAVVCLLFREQAAPGCRLLPLENILRTAAGRKWLEKLPFSCWRALFYHRNFYLRYHIAWVGELLDTILQEIPQQPESEIALDAPAVSCSKTDWRNTDEYLIRHHHQQLQHAGWRTAPKRRSGRFTFPQLPKHSFPAGDRFFVG